MKCTACSQPVRPVVALDIDGTLAAYHASFLMFMENYLDIGPSDHGGWNYHGIGEFSEAIGIEKHIYQQVKLAFRAGGNKRWMPKRAGLDRLIQACWANECEVWITTTRPWMRLDNIDPDTREWLRRNNIRYDHLLFDEDKYFELLQRVFPERIVFVLEDQADQYDRASHLGLPVWLARSHFNEDVRRTRMCGTLSEAAIALDDAASAWRS